MSNLGPRPDSADNEAGVAPSTFETGDFAAEPVSPAAPSFDAATVTPPEPETMPGYPRPAPESFTVPREPDSREPRDKLWVHFAWEGLLLVLIALGIAAFFLFGPSGGLINPDRVSEILAGYSPFLLFAMAIGVSMRVGSVNLAVVHLALVSTAIFSSARNTPLLVVIGVVALFMVVAGVLLALLVTVFKAPGWAASLGVAMVAWFLVSERELGIISDPGFTNQEARPQLDPLGEWAIVAAVVGLSIAGGVIGLMRSVRRTMGVCVDVADRRRGLSAGSFFLTWGALILSCLLAGAAGYLVLLPTGANLNVAVVNANGLAPLLTGLGIVLIGGTAARGRRGGVFGTLLAAVVVFMVAMLFDGFGDSWIVNNAIPFGALLLGLLVNWGMDLVNRPKKTLAQGLTPPVPQAAAVPLAQPGFAAAEGPPAFTDPEPVSPAPVMSPAPTVTEAAVETPAAAEPPALVETAVATAEPPAAETPPAPAGTAQSGQPEVPEIGETTQEIPAGANPYLYRPPAG